jgi:hypothetical protein
MDIESTTDLTAAAFETITDRLEAAAALLHQAAERLAARESGFALEAEATLGRIVATVESQRETELEQKLAATEIRLAAAEAKLALSASVPQTVTHPTGRKTLPPAMANLLSKQGLSGDSVGSMEAGALDAALTSLSMEQRIAVKAQLMRAGLLG